MASFKITGTSLADASVIRTFGRLESRNDGTKQRNIINSIVPLALYVFDDRHQFSDDPTYMRIIAEDIEASEHQPSLVALASQIKETESITSFGLSALAKKLDFSFGHFYENEEPIPGAPRMAFSPISAETEEMTQFKIVLATHLTTWLTSGLPAVYASCFSRPFSHSLSALNSYIVSIKPLVMFIESIIPHAFTTELFGETRDSRVAYFTALNVHQKAVFVQLMFHASFDFMIKDAYVIASSNYADRFLANSLPVSGSILQTPGVVTKSDGTSVSATIPIAVRDTDKRRVSIFFITAVDKVETLKYNEMAA
ncbi:hypothetical protein [Sclerotinia sclerotiorum reovirus 1]|nr:hypothetical protein [Sclerotinia sclerotiorum reovirus 1]